MMTKTRTTRGLPPKELAPTLGPTVCKWIERYLVHAEGDYFGEPFKLRRWQKRLVYRAYELNRGRRRYHRALWGMPKGQGKTEMAAALALAELGGPVTPDGLRISPDIPVAAASFEQADILFGAARTMVTEGPLSEHFEVYETEILPKQRPGRLYRVAAVAGTNDGRRPTFFLSDELHEWSGKKERVHLVLSNGRAKRADAWELAITTAGWDMQSLLGRMYAHGKRAMAGEVKDPHFLFEWFTTTKDYDLEDPEQLEAAVREANPALGDFLPLDNIIRRYHEAPEHEFRRYHLNQWVSAPERWMPADIWDACAVSRDISEKTPVVLGFDGSYNQDSTALIGCTTDDPAHLFTVAAWERPEGLKDWSIDKEEVFGAIEEAVGKWKVLRLGFDDTFGRVWSLDMEALASRGLEVVEWPTRSLSRMAPACGQFYGAVKNGHLTHGPDKRLDAHMANAVEKGSRWGPVITKDYKNSLRHIDLAVAAVIAYDLAMRQPTSTVSWGLL